MAATRFSLDNSPTTLSTKAGSLTSLTITSTGVPASSPKTSAASNIPLRASSPNCA